MDEAPDGGRCTMSTLDLTDHNTLQFHEQRIQKGLATFIEVGESLWEIREGKLYRETHSTFEAYCKERWGISKTHANRLIMANEIQESVAPVGVKITSERQARELAKVEPERRHEVVEKAVEETGGKLTAKAIREAGEKPKTKKAVPFHESVFRFEFHKTVNRFLNRYSDSRRKDVVKVMRGVLSEVEGGQP
jgi:hypothetical protein